MRKRAMDIFEQTLQQEYLFFSRMVIGSQSEEDGERERKYFFFFVGL